MERIANSFRLVRQSYHVLMQDKELMILPLISGIITVAVAMSFFFGFGLIGPRLQGGGAEVFVPVFILYVIVYAIGIFFQAAVVAGATERLRGGNPTVGSALSAASRRLGSILAWAVIAATVGTILRAIQDRSGWLGRIIVGLIGAAWSFATFFVVPVLVLEDLSVGESFTRSLSVFKRTWGETVVGTAGVGIAAFVAWVALVAVTSALASLQMGVLALVVGAAGGIVLLILFSALQGVYVASLYRYATEGQGTPGFDTDLLARAFVPKGQ
jgi:hypothetical protein